MLVKLVYTDDDEHGDPDLEDMDVGGEQEDQDDDGSEEDDEEEEGDDDDDDDEGGGDDEEEEDEEEDDDDDEEDDEEEDGLETKEADGGGGSGKGVVTGEGASAASARRGKAAPGEKSGPSELLVNLGEESDVDFEGEGGALEGGGGGSSLAAAAPHGSALSPAALAAMHPLEARSAPPDERGVKELALAAVALSGRGAGSGGGRGEGSMSSIAVPSPTEVQTEAREEETAEEDIPALFNMPPSASPPAATSALAASSSSSSSSSFSSFSSSAAGAAGGGAGGAGGAGVPLTPPKTVRLLDNFMLCDAWGKPVYLEQLGPPGGGLRPTPNLRLVVEIRCMAREATGAPGWGARRREARGVRSP